jgi:acyl carrier protein
MATANDVKALLRDTLQLGDRAEQLDASTPLIGHLPELDSMAVVNILTAIEDLYGCTIDDEDVSADVFETVGSLTDFITQHAEA